jgi:hypothetical protein
MSEDHFSYSKNGKRQISPFIGREFLYDFVTGNLDAERKAAMQEFIASSPETKTDIQQIQRGLEYAAVLGQIQISDSIVEQIQTPSSYFSVLLRKLRFDDWSPAIKLGLEVMVVTIGVVSLALVIPWHRIMDVSWNGNKEIVLTEVKKGVMAHPDLEAAGTPEEQTVSFTDEGASKKPAQPIVAAAPATPEIKPAMKTAAVVAEKPATKKSKPVEKSPVVADVDEGDGTSAPVVAAASTSDEVEAPAAVAATTEASTPKTEAPSVPAPEAPADDAASTTTPAVVAEDSVSGAKKEKTLTAKGEGFLYRGSIEVRNVLAATQKFVDKINTLGGRKAGEVQLGWKKGNSSYFHFTIPEAKYAALIDFAEEYGGLTLKKEKNGRVMPEGIVRVIFTIKEKK